jgi:hypothetical protein
MSTEDDGVRDEVEGLLERHGDAAAEELIKTARFSRRMIAVMFTIFGLMFLAVGGVIVGAIVSGGPTGS